MQDQPQKCLVCNFSLIVKLHSELALPSDLQLDRIGVDFTFTFDNNHNNDNNNDNNNPHLNFFKGIVLGVKEPGLGIRDKG